jgi:hypothetical protein
VDQQYYGSSNVGDIVLAATGKTKIWVPSGKLLRELPFGGIATRSSADSPEELLETETKVITICHPSWHGIRQVSLNINTLIS